MSDQILVLDFGSQFTQLIARRVRELNVYCEIHPFNHIPQLHSGIKGVILSGSPCSVREAAFKVRSEKIYGIQFHPEVTHTLEGKNLLRNFVVHICGCAQDWTPDQFVETAIEDLKNKLGSDKVVMALSGGVDSTVAATLIHRAIGKNLFCIFVDNGLLRKGEFEQVLASYEGMGLNVKGIDAKQKFYSALSGLSEPEAKRK